MEESCFGFPNPLLIFDFHELFEDLFERIGFFVKIGAGECTTEAEDFFFGSMIDWIFFSCEELR